MRVWYIANKDNPYPSTEQKDELAAKTGLSRGVSKLRYRSQVSTQFTSITNCLKQISLWLANTRRRQRARQLPAETQHSYENLNPFDRWKILPVDQEATPLPYIRDNYYQYGTPVSEQPAAIDYAYEPSQFAPEQSSTGYETVFGQSMASFETGLTSTMSTLSGSFVSHPSISGISERRRRKHHVPKSTKSSGKGRPYQCTFCTANFATKYDWQRHETSQHLSLQKWTCCLGGAILYTDKFEAKCAFCGEADPDAAHLETHHYSACQEKPLLERTFYRKDHFFQHLRLTHEAKYVTHMTVWMTEQSELSSRCGFCSAAFNTWGARMDHLATHYKGRADMKDWQGDLGFEASIWTKVEKCTRTYGEKPHVQQFALPELPRSCYDPAMLDTGVANLPFDAGGISFDNAGW